MKVKLQRMQYNNGRVFWWDLINAEKPNVLEFTDCTSGSGTLSGLKQFCKNRGHEIVEINWCPEKPME